MAPARRQQLTFSLRRLGEIPNGSDVLHYANLRQTLASQGCCSHGRLVGDVVEVDDHHIRIKGSKDVLERAVLAGEAARESGSQMSTRWRARRDSNS
jgi:hypothetical protein